MQAEKNAGQCREGPDAASVVLPSSWEMPWRTRWCSLGDCLDYTERMRKRAVQLGEQAEKGQPYVPGSQGRFITAHDLDGWWLTCNCPGQAPTLEKGDRWFIDPPMMWEARGGTVLAGMLHVLPPVLWRHLN